MAGTNWTQHRRLALKPLALSLLLLVAPPWTATVWSEERVALVIGNGEYRHGTDLTNPTNDAADIAAALGRLGFAVTKLNNADRVSMVQRIEQFSRAAADAELAVVYYAGHGIEIERNNFLIPVDARLAGAAAAPKEAVPLNLITRAVSSIEGLRLIILDACRENPFADEMRRSSRSHHIGHGLGLFDPPGETLVAYAAKAGTLAADGEGRNSPYTAALLLYLEEPGVEVGLLLRLVRDAVMAATDGDQQPFIYGSQSSKEVYFKLPSEPEPQPSPQLAVAAAAQAKLSLTFEQRRRIQVALWADGFNPGLPTGRFDKKVYEQIRAWQSSQGLNATGYLDRPSADRLLTAVPDPSGPVWLKAKNRPCKLRVFRPEPGVMTAIWSGACADGKASGKGQRVLRSSLLEVVHDGEMRAGTLHGHATVEVTSGIHKGYRYEGDYRNGKRHGRGNAFGSNGVRYVGEYRSGKRDGWGTLTFPSGRRYEGEWRDGKREGKGKLVWANGDIYDGEWHNGNYHGTGIWIHKESGYRYGGQWRNGLRHGRASYTYPDGRLFEGEFRNGFRNGRGTWTGINGATYVGEYRDGKRHGTGTLTYSENYRYEGQWRDGKKHGHGTLILPPNFVMGGKYVGEFRNGVRHGRGTWTKSDGSRYVGAFYEGKLHGHGTWIKPDG